jgi:gamma-glutamyl hercynylcysteine S-oxide synthase
MNAAQQFRHANGPMLRLCLIEARAALERAFVVHESSLGSAGFHVPKLPIVNLPLWEYGHVAWFQERWLLRNPQLALGVGCDPSAPLSASSLAGADAIYDSSAVDHDLRWQLSLPNAVRTKQYAGDVLAASLEKLRDVGVNEPSNYLFWLCAAHEFMHAEAFAYTANTLALSGVATFTAECLRQATLLHGVSVDYAETSRFYFDNEAVEQVVSAKKVDAQLLDLDVLPVSWEMLLEFRSARNYRHEDFWPANSASARCLHEKADLSRNIAKPLDPNDPTSAACHVSFWEAQAWCLWRGRALPTEAQWLAGVANGKLAWGHVWEWTASEFSPFSGFVAHPYRDYSQPFFNKGYQVLKGGSIYTHERMKHPLYRNFFLPHRDDVCTGFRSCAKL